MRRGWGGHSLIGVPSGWGVALMQAQLWRFLGQPCLLGDGGLTEAAAEAPKLSWWGWGELGPGGQ